MLTADSPTSSIVPVGGRWVLDVDLVDVAGPPTVSVTLPELVTASPAAEFIGGDTWRAVHVPATPGRYVATVTVDGDLVAFAAYAVGVTTAGGMPVVDDVATYLGASAASWSTEDLTDALNVEADAQRDVCGVPAAYPAALRGALLRRVARNLAMRRLPLAVPAGDGDGGGPTILPGTDPEVRRLERPHRRMPLG